MTDNTVNFNEFKKAARKAKFDNFKRETKEKIIRAGKWYWEHKEVTLPVTVAVIGFATKGIGKLSHELAMRREVDLRDLRSWDPRAGEWFDLTRKLTNAEKVLIDARVSAGERKSEVLRDLGVLK